jgi:hypothetical protein
LVSQGFENDFSAGHLSRHDSISFAKGANLVGCLSQVKPLN